MKGFLLYTFSLLLLIGGVYLSWIEIKTYKKLKNKQRLFRRLLGVLILFVVAFMVLWGGFSMRKDLKPSPNTANFWFTFWAIAIGLILVTVFLALWDAYESLKYVGKLADESAMEDLKKIQQMLKKGKKKH